MAKDHVGKHSNLPQDDPRFRIAHLVRNPALRKALGKTEDELGPIPVLPKDEIGASGIDDVRSMFYRACGRANLAKMRHRVVEAEFSAAGGPWLKGKELAELQARRHTSFLMIREALMRFSGVPAMTSGELKFKKAIIGKVWLRKDSAFYEGIARDEAYLSTKAKGPEAVVAQAIRGGDAA
jgi:hypothetical protein